MDRGNDGLEMAGDGIGTRLIGREVVFFLQIDSTMNAARDRAQKGAVEGTVIIAGEQTAARGRSGRTWVSPPGNIALSVILRPDVSLLPGLVMAGAVAVARSIEATTGLKVDIKWPNDILVSGRKVCGILTEIEMKGGKLNHAILGIGINVASRPESLGGSALEAACLADEAGAAVSPMLLVRRLLTELDRLYLALPSGDTVYNEWRERLVTLGKPVTVRSASEALEGVAESVDRDGSLMLRLPDGSCTRVIAGDVSLRTK
ncbi:MAG: biotin--[acetyl-CoA-carboxylase] ligase [Chloroflexi bacterium]|nr:biotin--[acetyl-CoA-carboxylase] ligase [Chloroflexota bacterium]